jgi:hypothetical protein
MIAIPKPSPQSEAVPAWHEPFLQMLPAIQKHAHHAFRRLDPEAREDAVHEVIAYAVVAFARLVQLGKADLAYPSVLARYGVAQLREDRRVGNRWRIGEVLSKYAQRKKGFVVERLDGFDEEENAWREVLMEDKRATPADLATMRLDFQAWLDILRPRQRRIAKALATGESTGAVARKFKLSSGRISQLRRELKTSWETFQGEAEVDLAVA